MNLKNSKIFVVAILALVFSVSAKAETFYAYLTSAQEVPANASTGRGLARVVVNPVTLAMTFRVEFSGLTSNQTACHIHAPAAIGVNTGVAVNFGAVGGTSGVITGSGTLTATQLSQIRNHLGYVNLHTANIGAGELRGQLGIKRPVDFDGDGRQDLSILRFPTVAPQGIVYYNNNTTTGFQASPTFGDAATDFPTPGDFDGDGKDDIAIYRAGAVAGAQSAFHYIKSSDNTFAGQPLGLNGDAPVARDYDGDGITDAGVYRPGAVSGAQSFFYYRGSFQNTIGAITFLQFGIGGDPVAGTGDTPVPGDYDGDGKFDLAVYRVGLAPANTFFVRRSSDGGLTIQQWGNFTTDWIAPGDYDGDGKYDFAAARTGASANAPMTWFILNSSTSQMRAEQFGISSDTPAQGDYDGDARCDIAVYRRGAVAGAQSHFAVLNSFTNTASFTPWGVRADFATATFDAR